jgi:hypothetical protein
MTQYSGENITAVMQEFKSMCNKMTPNGMAVCDTYAADLEDLLVTARNNLAHGATNTVMKHHDEHLDKHNGKSMDKVMHVIEKYMEPYVEAFETGSVTSVLMSILHFILWVLLVVLIIYVYEKFGIKAHLDKVMGMASHKFVKV